MKHGISNGDSKRVKRRRFKLTYKATKMPVHEVSVVCLQIPVHELFVFSHQSCECFVVCS